MNWPKQLKLADGVGMVGRGSMEPVTDVWLRLQYTDRDMSSSKRQVYELSTAYGFVSMRTIITIKSTKCMRAFVDTIGGS